jgi:hypothetical protein
VKSPLDVGNFHHEFIEQAPVDSFVHSKISQTEVGTYIFKDFEYNRVTAEKLENTRYEDALRSLNLNDSIASVGVVAAKQKAASASKAQSFKGPRDHLQISIDSPLNSD